MDMSFNPVMHSTRIGGSFNSSGRNNSSFNKSSSFNPPMASTRMDTSTSQNASRPMNSSSNANAYSKVIYCPHKLGNQTWNASTSTSSENDICYVEKSMVDDQTDVQCIHQCIWKKMKPPSFSETPFISARQLDIVRAKLAGHIGTRLVTKPKMAHAATTGKKMQAFKALASL